MASLVSSSCRPSRQCNVVGICRLFRRVPALLCRYPWSALCQSLMDRLLPSVSDLWYLRFFRPSRRRRVRSRNSHIRLLLCRAGLLHDELLLRVLADIPRPGSVYRARSGNHLCASYIRGKLIFQEEQIPGAVYCSWRHLAGRPCVSFHGAILDPPHRVSMGCPMCGACCSYYLRWRVCSVEAMYPRPKGRSSD